MGDDKSLYTYWGKYLRTYEGRYDKPPHFLLVPCESEAHANRLRSALIQGGEDIYPEDYWQIVNPAYWAEFVNMMDCNAVAECLLNNPDFLAQLQQKIRQIEEKKNPHSYSEMGEEIISCEATDKDKVWGGCLEVAEYLLELLQQVCWFIDGISDALSIIPQLYSFGKNKRIQQQAEVLLEGGTVLLDYDGEISMVVDEASKGRVIPNWLQKAVKFISQSAVITAIQTLIDVGVGIITADINDDRIENIACALFDVVTCNKQCPYSLGQNELAELFESLTLSDNGASGLALKTLGLIAGGLSLFPLNDVMRNYRAGVLDPTSQWTVLCEQCDDAFEVIFDFTVSQHSDIFAPPTSVFGQTILDPCAWATGLGWGNMRVKDTSNRQREVAIVKFVNPIDLTNIEVVEMHYQINGGSGGSHQNILLLKKDDWSLTHSQSLPNLTINEGAHSFEGNFFGTAIFQVNGYTRVGNNPNGSTYLRRLVFRGRGLNPFA